MEYIYYTQRENKSIKEDSFQPFEGAQVIEKDLYKIDYGFDGSLYFIDYMLTDEYKQKENEYHNQQHFLILRNKRIKLLAAFDIWEKAVLRGRETDSEEIMFWYKQLLDLDESAFDNIPERIQYYL